MQIYLPFIKYLKIFLFHDVCSGTFFKYLIASSSNKNSEFQKSKNILIHIILPFIRYLKMVLLFHGVCNGTLQISIHRSKLQDYWLGRLICHVKYFVFELTFHHQFLYIFSTYITDLKDVCYSNNSN